MASSPDWRGRSNGLSRLFDCLETIQAPILRIYVLAQEPEANTFIEINAYFHGMIQRASNNRILLLPTIVNAVDLLLVSSDSSDRM